MTTSLALSEYEIERGKPMPDKNHAFVQGNFLIQLFLKYSSKFRVLPEVNLDLFIRERVPDLAIYPPMAFVPDENEIRMREVPLGVIEILSARQDLAELMIKCSEYFAAGVKSYWLALPALRTIYVFYAPNEYEIYSGTDLLQDKKLNIELDLAEIFK
ncbi:MAG: Uma2 family endonuclease [Saprospiraceae bacterium]|jgi:Uma2 family endonuclease|nr:Uma2 family endonuclease [Saprospiraceae bacterium]